MSSFQVLLALVAIITVVIVAYTMYTRHDHSCTSTADAHRALAEARAARTLVDAGNESLAARVIALETRLDSLGSA